MQAITEARSEAPVDTHIGKSRHIKVKVKEEAQAVTQRFNLSPHGSLLCKLECGTRTEDEYIR